MSLRARLVVLLSAFALFALAAASATIYGVRLYVEDALTDFRTCMDQTRELDYLRTGAREQLLHLKEIVSGRAEPGEAYLALRDAWFDRLEQAVRWFPEGRNRPDRGDWAELARITPKLRAEFAACLAEAASEEHDLASARLDKNLEQELWPALETRLQNARTRIDAQRSASVNSLVATNTQLLVLAALVAALGAGLVVIGAALIRRWLILPISELREATERLGRGEMNTRVRLESQDELAQLGASLNHMAESVLSAQEALQTSEAKFRSLFQNLRDAVLICDADGRIIEHHDGDLNLIRSDWRGRSLADLWPQLCPGEPAWSALLERTLVQGARTLVTDVPLRRLGSDENASVRVDLIAYRVEYGRSRYAAIVLRDATERHELQRRSQQAEAMKATISFAQGIAHDFNNLLTSGISTLTRVRARLPAGSARDDTAGALRACWQAARLARRLLDFAAQGRGQPQSIRVNEAVATILDSLDENFFRGVRLATDCHSDVFVYMDRDHLTQVVLNLIQNAREAMPDGGDLSITVRNCLAAEGELSAGRRYGRLTVEDTGMGMSEEVRQKIFEPFFSTKPRSEGHRRGMGLAVVYAAVRDAGGLLEVESRVGAGTRFTVVVPSAAGLSAPAAAKSLVELTPEWPAHEDIVPEPPATAGEIDSEIQPGTQSSSSGSALERM